MLKIRRPNGRLIFNMGIPIPGKTVFYIETGPRIFSIERHKTPPTPTTKMSHERHNHRQQLVWANYKENARASHCWHFVRGIPGRTVDSPKRRTSYAESVNIPWSHLDPEDLLDHSEYGLKQWEATIHCNVVSHRLSTYPKWSHWSLSCLFCKQVGIYVVMGV